MRAPIVGRDISRLLAFIAATAVIAVALPTPLPTYYRLAFLAYAWTLYGILRSAHKRTTADDPWTPPRSWSNVLFFGALVLVLFSRLIPFLRYGSAPLGYDTGYYVEFYRIIEGMRTIHPAVITTSHLAYSSWFPSILLGLPEFFTINALHILHQLLTVGALAFFVRSAFRDEHARTIGAIAALLFALSVNQFAAYWWMFYKQSMAIPFLLFAFGLLFRRSLLAIPIGAFAAAIHLQSAMPFAAAFALFAAVHVARAVWTRQPMDRDAKRCIIGFLAIAGITFLLKGPRELRYYLGYFLETGGRLSSVPFWRIEETKGLFIPLPLFLTNALFWIPLAIASVVHVGQWLPSKHQRIAELLLAMLAVLIALTALPVIYQNRTLILLDFLVITFAAPQLLALLARPVPRAIPTLLLIGALATTSLTALRTEPQVTRAERAELERLGQELRQHGGYAMATDAMYSPWVYLFTRYDTIAPGALNWNQWDLAQWQEFWNTGDDERRTALLRTYGERPIYLFIGNRQRIAPTFRRFLDENSSVAQWSPHIWQYTNSL
jgi:hypothetical protein